MTPTVKETRMASRIYDGELYCGIIYTCCRAAMGNLHGAISFFDAFSQKYSNLVSACKYPASRCFTEINAARFDAKNIKGTTLPMINTICGKAASALSHVLNISLPIGAERKLDEKTDDFLKWITKNPKKLAVAAVAAGILSASAGHIMPAPNMWGLLYYDADEPVLQQEAYGERISRILRSVRTIHEKPSVFSEKETESDMIRAVGTVLNRANSSLSADLCEKYASAIVEAGKKTGVEPGLITGIILAESTGRHVAKSNAGAAGLMQVMWSVWGRVLPLHFPEIKSRDDLFDPHKNIKAGTWIIKGYLNKSGGDVKHALSRYRGGHSSAYYKKIMKYAKEVKRERSLSAGIRREKALSAERVRLTEYVSALTEKERVFLSEAAALWRNGPELSKIEIALLVCTNFPDYSAHEVFEHTKNIYRLEHLDRKGASFFKEVPEMENTTIINLPRLASIKKELKDADALSACESLLKRDPSKSGRVFFASRLER